MRSLSSDSSATNKRLAIRSGGITSRWAHAAPYRTHPSAKGVLFGPEMMHVHLQAKMRGCAVVNCGHSARQSSSPTFSCYSAKLNGRKACSRPAALVRAEKKDQGLYGNIQQRLQGVSGCFAWQQLYVSAEGGGSQLQQLGEKASGAVSKAAGSVRDAFTEIDDNFLEYCSLDAKVISLCCAVVLHAKHLQVCEHAASILTWCREADACPK